MWLFLHTYSHLLVVGGLVQMKSATQLHGITKYCAHWLPSTPNFLCLAYKHYINIESVSWQFPITLKLLWSLQRFSTQSRFRGLQFEIVSCIESSITDKMKTQHGCSKNSFRDIVNGSITCVLWRHFWFLSPQSSVGSVLITCHPTILLRTLIMGMALQFGRRVSLGK